MERTDREVRVYLTTRPNGQVEWQVIALLDDGQTEWIDGQVYTWRPGVALVSADLLRSVLVALRAAIRAQL